MAAAISGAIEVKEIMIDDTTGLVPGIYEMTCHAVNSSKTVDYYSRDAWLVLRENGTCHGAAVEQGIRHNGLDLPAYICQVKDGSWSATNMTFTYIYGTCPYQYTLHLSPQPGASTSEAKLVGEWKSMIAPNEPQNFGTVKAMLLSKIA